MISQLLIKTKIQIKKCLALSLSDVVFIIMININIKLLLKFMSRVNFVKI